MKTVAFFLLAFASIAHAGPSQKEVFNGVTFAKPACFGHAYSAKELAQKSKQTVSAMKVTLMKYSADTTVESSGLKVELKLKSEPKATYKAEFSCFDNEGQTLCAIDCDGGSVVIESRTPGELKIKSNGFTILGGCDDQTDEVIKRLASAPGQDDVFKLEAKSCTM